MTSFEYRMNQFSANMEAGLTKYKPLDRVQLNTLTVKEVAKLFKSALVEYENYEYLFTNVDGKELDNFGICDIMTKRTSRQLSANMIEFSRVIGKFVRKWKKHGVKYSEITPYEFTTGIIRNNGQEDAEGWIIYNSHLFPNEVAAGLIPTWSQYINEGMHADPAIVKRHFNF